MASHRESDGDEQELLDLRISEDVENNAMAYMFEPRAARCFFFFIKHLYTGPEYGATSQSKTPSCQSGRLMIKQCAMIQNNLCMGGSIQHIYVK